MTPAERMRLALALGQQAIDAYAAAHSIDRAEARRRLERAVPRLSEESRGLWARLKGRGEPS